MVVKLPPSTLQTKVFTNNTIIMFITVIHYDSRLTLSMGLEILTFGIKAKYLPRLYFYSYHFIPTILFIPLYLRERFSNCSLIQYHTEIFLLLQIFIRNTWLHYLYFLTTNHCLSLTTTTC